MIIELLLLINSTLFHRLHAAPLNRIITNILKLQNPSDKDFVAYKVKTTRPQRYCVRPNIGVIPPGETIELQSTHTLKIPSPASPAQELVISCASVCCCYGMSRALWLALTPLLYTVHFSFHKDPPKSLHCKDKFQVESLILDPSVATGEDISLSELVPHPSTPLSLPILQPACVVWPVSVHALHDTSSLSSALLPSLHSSNR